MKLCEERACFCHRRSLPSFLPPLSFTLPSLAISSSAPPSLALSPSLCLFFSLLLLPSTRLLCASPVSQRIPLVAQLRDSAGKLRLFKARSAGKARSCWKRGSLDTANQPLMFTHCLTHTHTSHSESTAFSITMSPCISNLKDAIRRETLFFFWSWTFCD